MTFGRDGAKPWAADTTPRATFDRVAMGFTYDTGTRPLSEPVAPLQAARRLERSTSVASRRVAAAHALAAFVLPSELPALADWGA